MTKHWIVLAAMTAGCDGAESDRARLLTEGEEAALLSVWGRATDEVWAVGGRATLEGGPLILEYDGARWTRHTIDAALDLWWVFGVEHEVFLAGSGGTILRAHGGEITPMATPRASGTIFGMWGASPDDVWAVGDAGERGALLWRYDGEVWRDVAPPVELSDGQHIFKVDGRAGDDVWFSCSGGATLHFDGEALTYLPTGSTSDLFSIAASDDATVAVGGVAGGGELYERGDAWRAVDLPSTVAWRGATARADRVVAVGEYGLIAERAAGRWSIVEQDLTASNLHAAWLDPDGGLWAVGGQFDQLITRGGFLLYMGRDEIAQVAP